MVLVYPIDAQTFRYFVERMHFEEAEIGARNGQENRNRTLTTDPGRFNVPRARLAPAMISTPGHWVSRRRQREALPAWSLRIAIGYGVFLLDREGVAYLDTTDLFGRAGFLLPTLLGGLRASLTVFPAWNRTALLAGILILSPVCGFRPSRAGRAATLKVPRPETRTGSPATRDSRTACTTAFTASVAVAWVSVVF
jgi:hypothetical protein